MHRTASENTAIALRKTVRGSVSPLFSFFIGILVPAESHSKSLLCVIVSWMVIALNACALWSSLVNFMTIPAGPLRQFALQFVVTYAWALLSILLLRAAFARRKRDIVDYLADLCSANHQKDIQHLIKSTRHLGWIFLLITVANGIVSIVLAHIQNQPHIFSLASLFHFIPSVHPSSVLNAIAVFLVQLAVIPPLIAPVGTFWLCSHILRGKFLFLLESVEEGKAKSGRNATWVVLSHSAIRELVLGANDSGHFGHWLLATYAMAALLFAVQLHTLHLSIVAGSLEYVATAVFWMVGVTLVVIGVTHSAHSVYSASCRVVVAVRDSWLITSGRWSSVDVDRVFNMKHQSWDNSNTSGKCGNGSFQAQDLNYASVVHLWIDRETAMATGFWLGGAMLVTHGVIGQWGTAISSLYYVAVV